MPLYCSDLLFFVGSNLLVFGFYWICLFVKGLFVHHSLLGERVFSLWTLTYCWVPFVFVAGCVWSAVKYLQIGFAPLSSAPSLWPSSYYGLWSFLFTLFPCIYETGSFRRTLPISDVCLLLYFPLFCIYFLLTDCPTQLVTVHWLTDHTVSCNLVLLFWALSSLCTHPGSMLVNLLAVYHIALDLSSIIFLLWAFLQELSY